MYDHVSMPYTSLMLTIMPSSFVNAITSQKCSMPGSLWKGGLLADEMGLGKTLSMIALVASDLQTDTNFSHELPSTLIIVPLSCKHNYRPS
jgi:SWI/SNF-related matrix-associated actin-dependent regulator of chromatin subfamily A3